MNFIYEFIYEYSITDNNRYKDYKYLNQYKI